MSQSRLVFCAAAASALLVSACAARPVPNAGLPASSSALTVYAEQAHRGPIQRTMAYTGEIRSQEQVAVLPKASGRIQSLPVDVSSSVRAGDPIAQLDSDSVQLQVRQAEAALAGAQAKLDQLNAGPRAEDVAMSTVAVRQQQSRLDQMLAGGRDEDVRAAQAGLAAQQARLDLLVRGGRAQVVRQAQDALDAANARLSAVEKGASDDVRQAAQSSVDADAAALASAEAAYAALGASNAADLQAAQSQVDTLRAQVAAAQSTVAAADAALNGLPGSSAADVQQAQSALDQAQAQVRAARAVHQQAIQPLQATLAQAQAALEQAAAQRQQAEAQQSALEHNAAAPCVDLPGQPRNSTACGDARTAAKAAVQAGNANVEAAQSQADLLKRGGGPASLAQVTAAVDQAEAQATAAEARLDALKRGGIEAERANVRAQRAQSASQLEAAQQGLAAAEARLASLARGAQDAQVKAAAAQVTAARERLKSDQARLAQVAAGPTSEELDQARAEVDQAEQQVALAAQPNTDQEIQAQRAAVEQASHQVDKARAPFTFYDVQQQEQAVALAVAQLHKTENPYTEQDLSTAQAAVDQAQAQLELARLALKDTRVLAPVDGVIAERLVAPGALVGPTTVLVKIVPPTLDVVVNVEEARLGEVRLGQSVSLQVTGFPDQPFAGTVNTISPTVDSPSRTASVRIRPSDPDGRLKPGMSTAVQIQTARADDAIVVPQTAVLKRDGQSVVFTEVAGRARLNTVQIGLSTDNEVQITSGIQSGDRVILSATANLTDGLPVLVVVAPPQTAFAAPL